MRHGGIFTKSGLGDLPMVPSIQNMIVALTPAAGSNPFAGMLQSVLKQQGATNIKTDGVWGQCSHSAFKNVIGEAPSAENNSRMFALDKYGIPTSNIQVWQPGTNDVCYNGTDKYTQPADSAWDTIPDPALVFAKTFGVTPPASVCQPGSVPNMDAQRCQCGPGTILNVNTGACDMTESPAKLGPSPAKTIPNLKAITSNTGWTVAIPKMIGQVVPVKGTPGSSSTTTYVKPGVLPVFNPQPAAAGMGTKIVLGLLFVGVLGGGAWLIFKPKTAVANRRLHRRSRRCRRNCGE